MARTSFHYDDLYSERTGKGVSTTCEGAFYCLGTLFARSLYQAMLALGLDPDDPDARGGFARDVVAAMRATKQAMRSLPADVVPLPSSGVARCERADRLDAVYDGEMTGAFLAAFLSQMPAGARDALCDTFADNFGALGFPEPAYRAECQESRP